MKKLTKNFSFVDKNDNFIYETTLEIESRFLNKDFNPIPTLARRVSEAVLKEKMGLESNSLSELIFKYKETWGDRIVVDALYQIKKWGNQESHYSKEVEEINFVNALFVLKSLSILLQATYIEEPNFSFTEVPYQESIFTMKNNQDKSISSSELEIQKANLFDWFKSKHIIFKIPFYQRNYTWKHSNLEVLIEDIKNRSEDQHKHYFGVIALKRDAFSNNDVELKIIDGQQRITTSLIFLRAAYDFFKKNSKIKIRPISPLVKIFEESNIADRYFNDSAKSGEFIEFKNILNGKYVKVNNSWRYGKNYDFFSKYLNALNSNEVSDLVYSFINKFDITQLVYKINPDREMDVFENMNSKGTELKEWDLIRNQIFNLIEVDEMNDLEKVKILDNNFVYDFISGWKEEKNYLELSNFFVEYIYSKIVENKYSKYLPRENFSIYYNFKELYKNLIIDSKDKYLNLLRDFKKYSIIYKSLVDSDISLISKDFKNIITFLENRWRNISQKKQIYPAIISLFIKFAKWDLDNWVIKDMDNLVKGIEFIDSLLIRLEATKGFGHSLRNNSLRLAKLILKEDSFVKVVQKMRESNEKFIIEDDIFYQSLKSNFIKQQLARKMLFQANKCLFNDNGYGTDIIVANPSLEHVMPQKIEKWEKYELNKVENWNSKFKEHINLLGNFYVVPIKLNQKLSNDLFKNKKIYLAKLKTPMIIGDKENGIRSLLDIKEWTFDLIKSRTNEISNLLVKKVYKLN